MSHKKSRKKAHKAQKMLSLFLCLLCLFVAKVKADDGYRLWLRYDQLPSRSLDQYRSRIKSIAVQGKSATFDVIREELSQGCAGLLGVPVAAGLLYPFMGLLVSPVWASAAMTLSSVSVIVNALRLRHAKL